MILRVNFSAAIISGSENNTEINRQINNKRIDSEIWKTMPSKQTSVATHKIKLNTNQVQIVMLKTRRGKQEGQLQCHRQEGHCQYGYHDET